ncbi:MAG TPA: efflux RND transporter periplasmic adaptor subunit, partial [Acidobacteriota bacterium]|nr:efflux RND transporter periplasmic adaptor subunit [Acidobacteriota bacterium]
MSARKKVYGFLGLVVIFALAAYLLMPFLTSDGSVSQADSESAEEETRIPVEIAVAREGDISHSISSTANLKPKREVEVASQIEGVAMEVLVEEGDFVQEGQLLCHLADAEVRIRLLTAKQKLAQAKLQLERAQILNQKSDVQVKNNREELERYENLYKESLVSEREVAEIKYRMDDLGHDLRVTSSESRELAHKVEELEGEIEQAELELARTRIEAPFSGYITERNVDVGQTVKNLDSIFKLGDFSPLMTDVFVSEREAAEIAPGQGVTIYSGVDGTLGIDGRVARISPIVDQATGTVKVTVELNGHEGLFKPGAFVRVTIRTDTRVDSVLVPKRAVVEEDGESFVFITEEDSVKRMKVDLGYESDRDVEIVHGVGP